MSKYKKQFQLMIEENSELFAEFKELHDNFLADEVTNKEMFNTEGTKIHRIIRRYENALCSKSENSGYGKFSENLSDKFWIEVRAFLPAIDRVEMQ